VTVTLGSSKQDFEFETDFSGQRFSVKRWAPTTTPARRGTDLRRQQATRCHRPGRVGDHYQVA